MDILYERSCGLDIGKRFLVACLCVKGTKQTRRFSMMTRQILALGDWLLEHGVTHVAMESTGVYWKPIYNLLESYDFELFLINARDFRAVPGRKTDVKDADWLVDLLRHGLLRASFVPPRPQRELRELIRYRKSLVGERTRELNRIEKVLEGANVKLGTALCTLKSKSARKMLWALARGEEDMDRVADLAHKGLKAERSDVIEALHGAMGAHQRFMLSEQLNHLDELEGRIARLSDEVASRLAPAEEVLDRLQSIPGVGRQTAEVIAAEVGLEVERFPTSGHLASWAKLCPGSNESAGKRKSGRTGRGNQSLRTALVEAAQAASRTKGTYLQGQYHRLAARRGKKRAVLAVAHSILVIAYVLLKEGTVYQDLGANYFDEQQEAAVVKRMARRLEKLGYAVKLEKQAA